MMRHEKLRKIILGLITAMAFIGCKEHIDMSARYVFTEETVYSYLSKQNKYSQYVDLLGKVKVGPISESTLKQLLAARGNYTVFAPTDEAIQLYLDTLAMKGIIDTPDWDGFRDSTTLDSVRQVIVYNSIIDMGDNLLPYETANFPVMNKGEFPLSNMYQRKLVVTYCDVPDSIWINGASVDVYNRDIQTENGVIHCMHNVVAPTNNTLGYLLEAIYNEKRTGYYVSAMLVKTVGMLDTLYKYRDDEYEKRYQEGLITKTVEHTSGIGFTQGKVPEHRYYGYTYFAETDSFWQKELGKEPLDITVKDVMDYLQAQNLYPDAKVDEDYTHEDNLLNRFVTYHFLPMRLAADRMVIHWNEKGYSIHDKEASIVTYEYYTTMGKRRLMKFLESPQSNGVCINRFPNIDNGRKGEYIELSCDPDKVGIRVSPPETDGEFNVRNGIVYPLNEILAYSPEIRRNLHKERIRWDIAAQMPELMNNDIRSQYYSMSHTGIPFSSEYPYLDDCWVEDDSYYFYYNGWGSSMKNYQGDELNIRGNLDVTFRLPPVPEDGIYELRFNIQSDGYNRGMVQFYWGNDKERLAPMGIPMDIRMSGLERRTTAGTFPSNVGWERDLEDDQDYNAEVDKKMRNNGFMKGANCYCDGGTGMAVMARADPLIIRRIIVREPMKADETYYLRFKTVLDDASREFYVDYLEYCPKEVYDNPETPEDIW